MQILLEGNFMKFLMRLPCHRGGVKVSPRWKQDATAVAESRHRGDRNFCKSAPGKTHYKKVIRALIIHTQTALSHDKQWIFTQNMNINFTQKARKARKCKWLRPCRTANAECMSLSYWTLNKKTSPLTIARLL